MVSASIGYWTIKLELVKPNIAQVPWPSPIGFGAFIGTAGSLMAVLVSLICGFVAFLIWFPFIKIYDKKLVEQEKGNDALI